MKTLNLETTAPFQGLSELVAYDEGLFAEEGIDITWGMIQKLTFMTNGIFIINQYGMSGKNYCR